ncbi:MAG: hypothetical protein RL094_136 [Candidatus Parcubacteria bacterium]
MKLPGQHVLILGAICLSILGGVGAYKYAQYKKAAEALRNRNGIVASAAGTNADTQSKEYAEILAQIELAKIDAAASTTANPFLPSPNDTMTDSLSKNVFISYLKYQGDDNLDAAGQAEIANAVVSNIDASKLPGLKYSLNSIKMTYSVNVADIKLYGNTFATIRNKHLAQIAANSQFYNTHLVELGAILSQLGEELMKMNVPSEVALPHLDIANAYIRSGESFKIISGQAKDPLKALLGVKVFKDDLDRQTEMYTQISNYFSNNGILFDTTEPGIMWNISTSRQ